MSKVTPCPVCGWWNETNDACSASAECIKASGFKESLSCFIVIETKEVTE